MHLGIIFHRSYLLSFNLNSYLIFLRNIVPTRWVQTVVLVVPAELRPSPQFFFFFFFWRTWKVTEIVLSTPWWVRRPLSDKTGGLLAWICCPYYCTPSLNHLFNFNNNLNSKYLLHSQLLQWQKKNKHFILDHIAWDIESSLSKKNECRLNLSVDLKYNRSN